MENSEKLGGPGKIVEIDESKFGKRKYHKGHHVEGQWVFGGYERGTGRTFVVPVEDRSAETLLPIIKDWIMPETTIYSDCWAAYNCLQSEGYKHFTVNHTLHFKDPLSDTHINAIESSWRAAKTITTGSSRRKAHILGNLAKYMFYKRCEQLNLDRTEEFFRLAGKLYNALDENQEEYENEEDEEDLTEKMLD